MSSAGRFPSVNCWCVRLSCQNTSRISYPPVSVRMLNCCNPSKVLATKVKYYLSGHAETRFCMPSIEVGCRRALCGTGGGLPHGLQLVALCYLLPPICPCSSPCQSTMCRVVFALMHLVYCLDLRPALQTIVVPDILLAQQQACYVLASHRTLKVVCRSALICCICVPRGLAGCKVIAGPISE